MAIDLYKNRCAVYEGDEPYIFISYSHKDMDKVVSLILKLQSLGFRIWYDSGVPAGAEWPEAIATHLKNSGCILSLLSANAAKSRHFKEEFNYAYYLQKPILVSYMEDCELTPGIEMRVVSQQCIKCEHCENDDDLLEEIARAKILLPCLGEKPDNKADSTSPFSEVSTKPISEVKQLPINVERLRIKAEKGDAQAQADLGLIYERGDGVEQNWKKAINLYRKAAEQDHQWAQTQLGICYYYGNGVERDYSEAAKWYRRSADQGQPAGQFNLGLLYYNGQGVDLDEREAVKWFQLSANQGFYAAQNMLAICYEKGDGIEKDLSKALELYRNSAKQGNTPAEENLGLCYEFSKGTEQDWEQAVYWYRRAAQKGQPYSQKKLSQCYREGLGVPIDLEESARWQKLYDENPNK